MVMSCRFCHEYGEMEDILEHENMIHRTEMYDLKTKKFNERFKKIHE